MAVLVVRSDMRGKRKGKGKLTRSGTPSAIMAMVLIWEHSINSIVEL